MLRHMYDKTESRNHRGTDRCGEQTDVIKRVGKDEERRQAGGITGK